MNMRYVKLGIVLCLSLIVGSVWTVGATPSPAPEQIWPAEAFRLSWQRTDQLVAAGAANYSWYWGPEPRSQPLFERDEESPGKQRLVIYYDKGRMEIEPQFAGAQSTAQLSFGRLVAEMVSGNMQLGARRYAAGKAARIAVAGSLDDALAPTYANFAPLTGAAPAAVGQRPGQSLDRSGALRDRPELASAYPTTAYSRYDDVTGHNIPRVFDSFMQKSGTVATPAGRKTEQLIDPLAVIGRPISEAYWADIARDGATRPVLVQLFERRVLTYTPSNPAAFQVEMGNVGLHYYEWRYGATARSSRVERVLDLFERPGGQALDGNYWFSFDDRGDGGTSTASNALISPGVFDSVHAMRFVYTLTSDIQFSFASLSLNLGPEGSSVDLRGISAVGFWARNSGGDRFSLQVNSVQADAPFKTLFTVPNGDWTWVEVPLAGLQQDPGHQTMSLEAGLSSASRISFRPENLGSGTLDIDNLVLISGETVAPPPAPGLPTIDNFEDGDLVSVFGTQWFTYDDRPDGGGSVGELVAIQPGSNGSRYALRFRGSFNRQWAKTPYLGMGVPLAPTGATTDISEYSALKLNVRTDGQQYRLQINSKLIQDGNQYGLTLVAPNKWTPLYIPFKLMKPLNGEQPISFELAATQVESIIITPLDKPEAFQLVIDDLELAK